MLRFRQYKNGIYGHRYRKLYIIKDSESKTYSISDTDGNVIMSGIEDVEDCKWEIDKAVATEDDLKMYQLLFSKQIYMLSSLIVELLDKKRQQGFLDDKDSKLFDMANTVRSRKADYKSF